MGIGGAPDWDEVVDQLGPRLYSYFNRRHLAEGASDLTQETLLRLFDKVQVGQFDAAKGNLAQLAFGIAHYERGRMINEALRPLRSKSWNSMTSIGVVFK